MIRSRSVTSIGIRKSGVTTSLAAAAVLAACWTSAPAQAADSVAGAQAAKGNAAAAKGKLAPLTVYRQTKTCVGQSAPAKPVSNGVSWAQQLLRYTSLWQFTRGEGVSVAVIDTGVNRSPAFGNRLSGLGDLVVAGGDGLSDCDGHGTLVAGLIGAAPDARSGFSGVAPAVRLLSIRQSSESYGPPENQSGADPSTDPSGGPSTAGTPASLASAIDYAVARGARVINISEALCGAAGTIDDGQLSRAVRAAYQHDVVVVSAAGNLGTEQRCSQQNTAGKTPVTAATPADLPNTLSVGAVDSNGQPAAFSLAGPWVDVAAPGTSITSTNPHPQGTGQVDRVMTSEGSGTIQGTSFSAPYVSGVVALVRARFPRLTAAQVISRIELTADHPAGALGRTDAVGYGTVDPEAALTAVLPAEGAAGASAPARPTALAAIPAKTSEAKAERVGLETSAGVLGVLVLVFTGRAARRARPTRKAGPA